MSLEPDDWQYRAVRTVLDAFSTRDVDRVLALCDPEIRMEFPFIGDRVVTMSDYREVVGRSIRFMEDLQFTDLVVDALSNPNQVVAQYRGSARIARTGTAYRQKYLSRFTFKDSLVVYFQENFDSSRFKQAFGLPIDWQMEPAQA